VICLQNCIHRKKKGNNIYCVLNAESEILMTHKMELKFGEKPEKINKFFDMRISRKCIRTKS